MLWLAATLLADAAPVATDAGTIAWAGGGAVGGALLLSQLLRPLIDAIVMRLKGTSPHDEMQAKTKTRLLIEAQGERIAELVRSQERIADALDRLAERLSDLRDDVRRLDRER
jgi:hypothetical protein